MPPEIPRFTGLDPRTIRQRNNPVVVQQHAGDSAFLWTQRCRATGAYNYKLFDLARVDSRLEAHLHGLTLAREDGWGACETQLGQGPAEIFPAAVIALGDPQRRNVPAVLDAPAAKPEGAPALVSALGCGPFSN